MTEENLSTRFEREKAYKKIQEAIDDLRRIENHAGANHLGSALLRIQQHYNDPIFRTANPAKT